jgi:DNA-binding SARP family transcriptional activator
VPCLATPTPRSSAKRPHPAGQDDGQEPPPAVSDPVAPAFCEVKLLGPVEVTRDGEPLTSLTPLTQQLLLYLVTHRDGVTAERLDDAIWAGQAAPPRSQRLRAALTKLRDALGDGPDGQPLLPRRQTATSLIRLSDCVGSDLDRAFAHLARARDLEDEIAAAETIAALNLVRGEPFEGLPLSWPTEITQRAISQLQDAAVAAAASLRQAQDHDEAERLIDQALRLCDPCEALYLEWAKLEADRGRGENIRAIWQRLRDRYGDDADETAGWTASPTLRTAEAFEALLTRND